MPRMKTLAPAQKVVGASLGGALGVIALTIVENIFPALEITKELQLAVMTVTAFVVGYYVPPGRNDEVVFEPEQSVDADGGTGAASG